MIRNADYIIDMGPGGGAQGGTVVAAGTPEEIAAIPEDKDLAEFLYKRTYGAKK